jgi:DNA polymerase III gamma/tau subunit
VATVAEQGLDLLHFTRQLLEGVRDLVVLKIVGSGDSKVALAPDELARALELAQAHERAELERLFSGLTKLVEDVGQAALPQMTLEMGLVRLAGRPPLVAVQELVERFKRFEDLLGGGGPRPSGPSGAGSGGGPGSQRPPVRRAPGAPSGGFGAESRSESSSHLQELPSAPERGPAKLTLASVRSEAAIRSEAAVARSEDAGPRPAPQLAAISGISSAAAAALRIATVATPNPTPARPTPAHEARFTPRPAHVTTPEEAPPHPRDRDLQERASAGADTLDFDASASAQVNVSVPVPVRVPLPAAPSSTPAPHRPAPTFDSDWARIVAAVRSAQPALAAVLDHGMPLTVNSTTLQIGFPDGSFFGRQAQSGSAREAVLKAAEQVLGGRPNLVIGSPGGAKVSSLAELEENGRLARKAERREAALRHPAVMDAMEIFEESEASVDVQVDLE